MSKSKLNLYGNILSQGINFGGQIAQFSILARLLTIEEFGSLGVIFSIAQFLYIFYDYGFSIHGTRFVAAKQNEIKLISELLVTSIIIKTSIYIISIIAIIIITFLFIILITPIRM